MLNIIDIGTNSARLMRADIWDGRLSNVKKDVITVRTGERIDETGEICYAAMKRISAALLEFRDMSEGKLYCFATSAFRDAKNKDAVKKFISDKTGIDVRIMTGEEEAAMGFVGVTGRGGTGTVIDIGGGSTEVICGRDGDIFYGHSFNIGCVRALNLFGAEPDRSCVEEWARGQLSAVSFESCRNTEFFGIGGSVTTLAAIELGLAVYDRDKVNGYALHEKNVSELCNMLYAMSTEDRKHIDGLRPERADIITFGASILLEYMRLGGLESVTVSESDNLEGYAILYCI